MKIKSQFYKKPKLSFLLSFLSFPRKRGNEVDVSRTKVSMFSGFPIKTFGNDISGIIVGIIVSLFVLSSNVFALDDKDKRYQHAPYKNNNCEACHIKDSNELITTGNEMCNECHKRIVPAGNRYVHQALEQGCLVCHKPHASDYRALLKNDDLRILCEECHMAKSDIQSHPLTDDITCISYCHFPHSSKYKYLLQKEGNRQLCISCHKEFDRRKR